MNIIVPMSVFYGRAENQLRTEIYTMYKFRPSASLYTAYRKTRTFLLGGLFFIIQDSY